MVCNAVNMHNPMLFRMYTLFYSLLCSITSMTLVHPFVLCSVNVVFRIYRLTFDVAVVHFRLNPTEMPLTMGFGYFRNFQFKRFFFSRFNRICEFFPFDLPPPQNSHSIFICLVWWWTCAYVKQTESTNGYSNKKKQLAVNCEIPSNNSSERKKNVPSKRIYTNYTPRPTETCTNFTTDKRPGRIEFRQAIISVN